MCVIIPEQRTSILKCEFRKCKKNQICISKQKEAVIEKQSEEAGHTNQAQKTTQHNK